MAEPHVTIIPCRSIRFRGGLVTLSGVSNLLMTDGAYPFAARRVAAYLRMEGERVAGRLGFAVVAPNGEQVTELYQPVPPYDTLGVAETWFEAEWLKLPTRGRYHLVLELNGIELWRIQILVTD